jgi:ADP-heptose:LPS heptosyltransferase
LISPGIASAPRKAERILVARLDSLGDCVLSSGFFAGLRTLYPRAEITAAFSASTAALFAHCPLIDRLVAVPRGPTTGWRALIEPPYDMSICPRWDVDHWSTRTLALLSQAPVRIGFDRGSFRYEAPFDGWSGAYFTDLAQTQSARHEVLKSQDMLHFLGATGAIADPMLWIAESSISWAAEFVRAHGLDRYAVLAVSAGQKNRVWPVENFLPVIDALHRQTGLRFVVIGADDASAAGAWLEAQRPGVVVCATGTVSILSTAALIATSALYVGMDTGPMHLAAASGVPVVEISCHPLSGAFDHANSPSRFGPYATRSRVLQPALPIAPCDSGCMLLNESHCIAQVSVADVIAAALELCAPSPR